MAGTQPPYGGEGTNDQAHISAASDHLERRLEGSLTREGNHAIGPTDWCRFWSAKLGAGEIIFHLNSGSPVPTWDRDDLWEFTWI
jgi:hypothetical protein